MNEVMSAGRSFNNDPAENLKKKPRKSILKSSSSFEVVDGAPTGSKRKSVGPNQKETKWDEKNIQETLHPLNKDYGHMKIEEPKTPYERLVGEELASGAGGVDPKDLAQRLTQQKGRKGKQSATSSDSSDDEKLSPDKTGKEPLPAKKKDFESKRKAHYNEFLAAKEALKNIKDDEDE